VGLLARLVGDHGLEPFDTASYPAGDPITVRRRGRSPDSRPERLALRAADRKLPSWEPSAVVDGFSERYGDLLFGSYDCVDRVVLNAYNTLCYSPGGFRTWWRRLHEGSDEQLDNTHLMRMAGRFARRVRGFARAQGIPVIECKRGERKHEIAEDYLATHTVDRGVFLILVARAVAPVWEVTRSATTGVIGNLSKKRAFVNHYSFHIMIPTGAI